MRHCRAAGSIQTNSQITFCTASFYDCVIANNSETPRRLTRKQQRALLIGALTLTLALALFFGGRLFWRFRNRPDRQPIRAWMSIPQVGRSYGIPPPVLYETLGIAVPPPGDRRPITDLATQTGKSETEIIAALETRVAQAPPREPRRKEEPATPEPGSKEPATQGP